MLERQGDEQAAFRQHVDANALSKRRWSPSGDLALADRLAEIITPELPLERRDEAVPDDRMIFIIDMSRSGRSLVERMLSAHPDIIGVGESTGIGDLWQSLLTRFSRDTPSTEIAKALGPRSLHSAARFYFEAIAPRIHDNKASRIVDKMPREPPLRAVDRTDLLACADRADSPPSASCRPVVFPGGL